MKVCIIKIGNKYFRKFILNTPELVFKEQANRFSMRNAKKKRRSLKKIGYSAEIKMLGEAR